MKLIKEDRDSKDQKLKQLKSKNDDNGTGNKIINFNRSRHLPKYFKLPKGSLKFNNAFDNKKFRLRSNF